MTSTSTLSDLRERRGSLWHQAKGILDAADAERRDLTAEERANFDRLSESMDAVAAQIAKLEESDQRNRDIEAAFTRLGIDREARTAADEEAAAALRQAVLTRSSAPIDVPLTGIRTGSRPGVERRALTTTNNVGTTFGNSIVRHMVDSSAILAAGATLLQTETGEPYKVPKSTALSSAAIVTEGSQIATSDPTLGVATLGAYKYAFLTSVSSELAQDASFDLLDYLAAQSGRALGNGFGAHAITGTGSSQPRGITLDTTLGVTGGTGVAGVPTADNLIDLYHSVAEPYARSTSAAWVMRNTTLGAVRKLKDSQNRYLFDIAVPPGSGAAGTLLGRPVFCDPTMPATATSAKSIVFGDIARYWVRLAGNLRFERSDGHGFDYDLVWFRAAVRMDGALVDTSGAVKHYLGGAS